MIQRRTPLKRSALKRTALKRSAKPLKRSPIKKTRRKSSYQRRRVRNVAYLCWLKEQPCAICQRVPSDAAHVGPRAYAQKCPDHQAIPLCHSLHHQEGPESHHVLGKRFWDHHGIDKFALISHYNAAYHVATGEPADNTSLTD